MGDSSVKRRAKSRLLLTYLLQITLEMTLFALTGCGGRAYLLQTKEPPPWHAFLPLIGSRPQENSPIPAVGSLSAFYDRSEIAYYEYAQEDGSVWVNYIF